MVDVYSSLHFVGTLVGTPLRYEIIEEMKNFSNDYKNSNGLQTDNLFLIYGISS